MQLLCSLSEILIEFRRRKQPLRNFGQKLWWTWSVKTHTLNFAQKTVTAKLVAQGSSGLPFGDLVSFCLETTAEHPCPWLLSPAMMQSIHVQQLWKICGTRILHGRIKALNCIWLPSTAEQIEWTVSCLSHRASPRHNRSLKWRLKGDLAGGKSEGAKCWESIL